MVSEPMSREVPKITGEDRKVLVVGAGGIGCELLKNLVLSGFTNIDVVDLDTIELSNLNRQFLFRRHHIGMFKAEIAAEAVMGMNAAASVRPHVGNIMDTKQFPVAFFASFSIVLNALDNLNARRYVNNMCLALGIPLVESGTAGYLGQCTVIIPRRTECYDCTPKEAPKTYAVCTIRSTPSQLIHCIVWAKDYLLTNLFGEEQPEEQSTGEITDAGHLASLRKETEAFKHFRKLAAANPSDEGLCREIFTKIFHGDIEALKGIESLWESRAKPNSIDLSALTIDVEGFCSKEKSDRDVWPLEDWIALLFDSLKRLAKRAYGGDELVPIRFDKDDRDTLDFVAATANVRAKVFGIEMNSRFQIKAMAGNIIPAIATTNAIAAGMIVIQARNVLAEKWENICDCFITFDATRKDFFARCKPCPPSEACATCHVHRARLFCSPELFKLGDIIEMVLPRFVEELGAEFAPEGYYGTVGLTVLEGNRMIYDEEDLPEAADKTLQELGIGDSQFVRCEFLEGLPLVFLIQADGSFGVREYGCRFDLLREKEGPKLGMKRGRPEEDGTDADDGSSDFEMILPNGDDDDDVQIIG